jgi:hypothetical protein
VFSSIYSLETVNNTAIASLAAADYITPFRTTVEGNFALPFLTSTVFSCSTVTKFPNLLT